MLKQITHHERGLQTNNLIFSTQGTAPLKMRCT